MKSADIREKIKKNVIVHGYEYSSLPNDLVVEIKELHKQLLEKYRQLPASVQIFIPSSHSIFSTGLKIDRKELEWATHTIIDGMERQRRELVYVERVVENANVTGVLDEKAKFAMDFSDESYTMLDCIHYGNRSILKLSGYDIKDISGKD